MHAHTRTRSGGGHRRDVIRKKTMVPGGDAALHLHHLLPDLLAARFELAPWPRQKLDLARRDRCGLLSSGIASLWVLLLPLTFTLNL